MAKRLLAISRARLRRVLDDDIGADALLDRRAGPGAVEPEIHHADPSLRLQRPRQVPEHGDAVLDLVVRINHQRGVDRLRRQVGIVLLAEDRADVGEPFAADAPRDRVDHLLLTSSRTSPVARPPCERIVPTAARADSAPRAVATPAIHDLVRAAAIDRDRRGNKPRSWAETPAGSPALWLRRCVR